MPHTGTLDELVDDIEYWERLYNRMPSSVTVVRTHPDDIKQRQMIVWLDGERIGTLMYGDDVTRDIDAGPHRLRVSNTLFWKSVDFEVKAGEQARFEIINRAGKVTWPMLAFIGVGPLYVSVRRVA